MKNGLKFLSLIILICLLIAVREIIAPILYDPLANYFKTDYLHKPVPPINLGLLLINILVRYILNSAISIAIIYVLFKNVKLVWFSFKIYTIVFLFFGLCLIIILKFNEGNNYLLLFYVRRFLIHPLIVLLLIPVFYLQKSKK
jgi:exosortase F-associated protein